MNTITINERFIINHYVWLVDYTIHLYMIREENISLENIIQSTYQSLISYINDIRTVAENPLLSQREIQNIGGLFSDELEYIRKLKERRTIEINTEIDNHRIARQSIAYEQYENKGDEIKRQFYEKVDRERHVTYDENMPVDVDEAHELNVNNIQDTTDASDEEELILKRT